VKTFYLPSLDGLRACAFLLVFLAHAGLEAIVPGGLGVSIFFFLSGYLITTLLRREFASSANVSMKNFYIRRSLRILPPMYLTLGLACVLALSLPAARRPTWLGIVSALAYFYNYADLLNNHVARLPRGMGVLWSLMIEEHFYLLFPFVYSKLLRSRLTRYQQGTLLVLVCMCALLWRYVLVFVLHTPLQTLPHWTYSSTDARFDSILWGCILAIVWNPVFGDGTPRLNRHAGKLACAGLSLMAASLIIRNPVFRETLRYSVQSIALLPIFYYCIAQSNAWPVRVLQSTPLRWIGWLSYSMYLSHEFLFSVVQSKLQLTGPPAAVVVFALALAYALGVRYLVELPSRDLQRTLTSHTPLQAGQLRSNAAPTGEPRVAFMQ
jgi:peptidoglycan/LPS O-acetylase OafA/YrhL